MKKGREGKKKEGRRKQAGNKRKKELFPFWNMSKHRGIYVSHFKYQDD